MGSEIIKRKSCIGCKYYAMEGGEERGRTSFDFCLKKRGYLPTAAFCFNDLCCSNAACYNMQAFSCLEEIAESCEYYEKK